MLCPVVYPSLAALGRQVCTQMYETTDRNTATEVSARLLELANPSHRDPGEDDFVGAALQAFSAMPTFFVEEHVSE